MRISVLRASLCRRVSFPRFRSGAVLLHAIALSARKCFRRSLIYQLSKAKYRVFSLYFPQAQRPPVLFGTHSRKVFRFPPLSLFLSPPTSFRAELFRRLPCRVPPQAIQVRVSANFPAAPYSRHIRDSAPRHRSNAQVRFQVCGFRQALPQRKPRPNFSLR